MTHSAAADDQAKYQQLIADIRQWLDTGMFQAGEPLPPVDDLAADRGLPPQTCVKALQALAEEGRLTLYPGLGYHVANGRF